MYKGNTELLCCCDVMFSPGSAHAELMRVASSTIFILSRSTHQELNVSQCLSVQMEPKILRLVSQSFICKMKKTSSKKENKYPGLFLCFPELIFFYPLCLVGGFDFLLLILYLHAFNIWINNNLVFSINNKNTCLA